jgi:thiamine biosynthesis protein ThiI
MRLNCMEFFETDSIMLEESQTEEPELAGVMNHVLIRYGEIGTKSRGVRRRMLRLLNQRLRERLAFEDVQASVRPIHGRLVVETGTEADGVAAALGELPGVVSTSPAIRTEPTTDAIKDATDHLDVGETFGVDANVAGERDFGSDDVNQDIGAYVEKRTGAAVNLDDPATWIEIDVRTEAAYVFTERYEGPGGFPVGSQDSLGALISGGIDSPVAAHAVMTRGADVIPIYFYNKPIAAGDHRLRFEESIDTLRRFHPGKKWYYYCIDMESVNEALMAVEGGRMILHRIIMFRVAERIAERKGLAGIVTGESLGQKSSQTAANLEATSRAIDCPLYRPLLTDPKESITQRAKVVGTFETATVASACRSLAPDSPAPEIEQESLASLQREVDIDTLVEQALEDTEKREIAEDVEPEP